MKRAVLDSNVSISALLFDGKPLRLLRFAEEGACVLLTSAAIRDEVEEVLEGKFSWPDELIRFTCQPIWGVSEDVRPTAVISACRDADDNRILECAVDGAADYIVTGDHDLLDMKRFGRIKIVNAAAFLQLF